MVFAFIIPLGVLGVLLRYGIDQALPRSVTDFPWSTLIINLMGCVAVGFIYQSEMFKENLKTGMIVGFCGGFTTFSGFGLQLLQLLTNGEWFSFALYMLASPVLGILAVYLGTKLA